MLRITDDHLYLTNTEEAKIKGKNTLIIFGIYSPMPRFVNPVDQLLLIMKGKVWLLGMEKKK